MCCTNFQMYTYTQGASSCWTSFLAASLCPPNTYIFPSGTETTHQCSRLCPLPEYVPVRCAGSGAFNTTSSFRIKKKVSTCSDSPAGFRLLCCCWCCWALIWWTRALPSPPQPRTCHSCSGGCTHKHGQGFKRLWRHVNMFITYSQVMKKVYRVMSCLGVSFSQLKGSIHPHIGLFLCWNLTRCHCIMNMMFMYIQIQNLDRKCILVF